MTTDEILVTVHGPVPAGVFNEGVIKAHVLRHWCAANRTMGDQCAWNAHVVLLGEHVADDGFVVIRFVTAWHAALKKAKVTLGVEETLFVEAAALKTVVDVGGDDKIIFVTHEIQEHLIGVSRNIAEAVEHEMAAPEGPFFFQRFEGIESGRVEIAESVLVDEIGEVVGESRPGHDETGSSRKPGAGSDEYRVGIFQSLAQVIDFGGD